MTREKVLYQCRERLPLPSEIAAEKYALMVPNWEHELYGGFINYVPLLKHLTFKKQRIAGVVVGWELETID